MPDNALINNITTLIESLVDNISRSQDRVEGVQKDVYQKLDQLKRDIHELSKTVAIDVTELTGLKARVQDLESKIKSKADWSAAQIELLSTRLEEAQKWIAAEIQRRVDQEKAEEKEYRAKVVKYLGKIAGLAGAGATGAGLTKIITMWFGG